MNVPVNAVLVAATLLSSIPQMATAQSASAPASATRPCVGPTTSLAWGAVVRDRRGPCRQARRPDGLAIEARAAVVAETGAACRNPRRWLGGAVQVCGDQPQSRVRP